MRAWRNRSFVGAALLPLAFALLVLSLPSVAGADTPEFGRISGSVTNEGGEPLERIVVCAEGGDEEGYGSECDRTHNDGTYEITGLEAGEYKVGFWSEGAYSTQWWEDAPSRAQATPVVVTAGEVTPDIDAVLEPGASISGTVTAGATGDPVEGVEVCAENTETWRCGYTNSAGEYTITGLYEGAWTVYFDPYETETELLPAPYAGGSVTLNAKEAKTGIDAELVEAGQISGTVRLASTGAPLAGVRVCLTEASSPEPYSCQRTLASGSYLFPGLSAGSFKVVFSPEWKELFPTELEWAKELEEWDAEENIQHSYATQWWNGASTFATASPIAIAPPLQVAGIDGSLAPTAAPPAAIVPPVVTKPVTKPALKCHKAFVKRRVKGKARCVKRKKKVKKHKPTKHRHKPVHAKQRATRD